MIYIMKIYRNNELRNIYTNYGRQRKTSFEYTVQLSRSVICNTPTYHPKSLQERDAGILADPFLCLEACNKYHNKEDS